MLCGGFPCQDYSVARSLSNEKGIEGKKGVLWWQIVEILKQKNTPFVLLENVDRLIKSPAYQRGKNFGIMLKCLNDLDYSVEWRTIDASNYGFPQKRKRVYIFAFKNSTLHSKKLSQIIPEEIITSSGIFAKTFPVEKQNISTIKVDITNSNDLIKFSNEFKFVFENSGFCSNGIIHTAKTVRMKKEPIVLEEIMENNVDDEFFLTESEYSKMKFLRGSKKIKRTDKNGFEYTYSESSMSPYDDLKLPGRTMLTSERSINRSTHIIKHGNRLRFLTPVECERLNQFPDNWTNTGMPKKEDTL